MNKYGVTYVISYAGYIEIEAKSMEDVFEKFDDIDSKEIFDNCTDLIEVEPYSIDQVDLDE
jgi:hypothetical protein